LSDSEAVQGMSDLGDARHLRLRTRTIAILMLLVTLGALVAPLEGDAREAGKVPRVGSLGPRTRADGAPFLDAFVRGLRDLGWVEGKNIAIEYRWAEGRSDRLAELAADLVRLKVDVILAANTQAAVAARNATRTIPIVMGTAGDPVAIGLVASLAQPGGNVTGLSFSVGLEMFTKELEMLKETVPSVHRVAVLSNPTNPAHTQWTKDAPLAARSLGVQFQILQTRGPGELDNAFAAMTRERAGALLVLADSLFALHRARVQGLAAKNRLPAMYGSREYAEAGGLMSYGVDVRANFRRAAAYVDKILRGVKPADLPVEQPTKFELVINQRTAKALGLTIPQSMLLRADEVIQ
jgi:putative tryptophan/tyrosine transport system substrate-binding protein